MGWEEGDLRRHEQLGSLWLRRAAWGARPLRNEASRYRQVPCLLYSHQTLPLPLQRALAQPWGCFMGLVAPRRTAAAAAASNLQLAPCRGTFNALTGQDLGNLAIRAVRDSHCD